MAYIPSLGLVHGGIFIAWKILKFKKTLFAVAVLLLIVPVFRFTEARSEYSYKGDVNLATEYPPPGEGEAIQDVIRLSKQLLSSMPRPDGRMKRDAHPKQYGLVKAEFTVLDTLHEQYRVGIFKKPKTFKAWVRYSRLGEGSDHDKDMKGMAIKLMGVEGEKLLPDEIDATTHDFLFMSTPTFVTKDVEGFADLMDALLGGGPSFITHLISHPRLTSLFMNGKTKDENLFDIHWGSTTPYLFGVRAVKYAVRPSQPSFEPPAPPSKSDDFLRERMSEYLSKKDINLDFFIQVQTDARRMPIEDPRVLWNENRSPMVKLATLRILRQEFDTPAQQLYGDQLSFTPWHALPAHRPIGGINRGRKVIYTAMSKFRHDFNGETSEEPTDWIDFSGE